MREIDIAKELIIDEIEKFGFHVINIILFGSRARGDFKEDSDWDILVIVKEEFSIKEKRRLMGSIYKRLARLEDSYEIIIKTERDFERMKKVVGSLSYDADLEGVTI